MRHYGKMILVLTSFLNEKGYNFKMSNYGGFFPLCTVNHVLKTSRLPLLCTVELISITLSTFVCLLLHSDTLC